MTDVFMFRAALYCTDCTRLILTEQLGGDAALASLPEDERDSVATADLLESVLIANGISPDSESNWDTDDYPKGPYPDGGGEADSPQHCDECHDFLENPLTSDGYKYVLEALQDNTGTPEVEAEWRRYYGDDIMPDDDQRRSINDILNTVRRRFTIIIEGDTDSDIETALEEVSNRIGEGYTSGAADNDTGNYRFDSEELTPDTETDDVLSVDDCERIARAAGYSVFETDNHPGVYLYAKTPGVTFPKTVQPADRLWLVSESEFDSPEAAWRGCVTENDLRDYQRIAEDANYIVTQVDNGFCYGKSQMEIENNWSDGYPTEAEAWEACCRDNGLV